MEIRGKFHKILIAENASEDRTLLRTILESLFLVEVKEAEDGFQADNKLRNESFDILITSIDLPRISPLELLKNLKEPGRSGQRPKLTIIFIPEGQSEILQSINEKTKRLKAFAKPIKDNIHNLTMHLISETPLRKK